MALSLRFALAGAFSLVLSSCGGSDGGSGGSPAGHAVDIFPFVMRTSPEDGASGVLPTQEITAEFSEPMDPAAITDSSFVVTRGLTSVTGAVAVIRYEAGAGWSTPEAIPDRPEGTLPRMAMDPATGFALVVWSEGGTPSLWPEGYQALKSRRYLPGSGWTDDEPVAPDEPDRALVAGSLAADGEGNLLVFWLRQRVEGVMNPALYNDMEIRMRRCSEAGWAPEEPGPPTIGQELFGRLDGVCTSDGLVTLFWYGFDSPTQAVRACRQTGPGTWEEELLMDYLPGPDLSGPGVTLPFPRPEGRIGVIGCISTVTNVLTGAGYGRIWVAEGISDGSPVGSIHHTAQGYVDLPRRAFDAAGRAAWFGWNTSTAGLGVREPSPFE